MVGAALVVSCAHEVPKPALGPPPRLPESKRIVRGPPPAEWFWEGVDAHLKEGAPAKIERPTAEAAIARPEGASRVWDDLGDAGRKKLASGGALIVEPGERALGSSNVIGAFYMDLRDARIPYAISLDALFYAARVAIVRAIAEVEQARIAPALDTLLVAMRTRLDAEQRGEGVEVGDGLRFARGVAYVASALLDRKTKIPADLDDVVQKELAKVDAHAALETSPLLGASIDYTWLAPPPDVASAGAYEALAWLSAAPLSLVARAEAPGAILETSTVRAEARAAMLLARFADREFDAKAADAYARVAKLLAFLWGRPDDTSLGDVLENASTLGVALANAEHVANVVKVDKLRKRAARIPLVFDGSAAPGRAGASVRLFGGAATADAIAESALVGARFTSADATPREIGWSLDVAAWLGAPEAKSALHELGADAYAGWPDALAKLAPPVEDDLHATLHGSMLAAIASWMRTPGSPAEERARMESALAAWTWLRSDGRALSRRERDRPKQKEPAELRVTGAPLAAFVEPAPQAIARLVGAVKQAQKGLATLGPLDAGSPALTGLADVEDLLRAALRIAEHEANDDPLDDADRSALASMPARLAAVEADAPPMTATVTVQTDRRGHVLVSEAVSVAPLATLVREPGSGRVVLAVTAHVLHRERRERDGAHADATRERESREAPPAWTAPFRAR